MDDHDEPSVTYLVSSLKADITAMVADQIELAKAEMKGSAKHGGIGAGLMVFAGVLLALAGLLLSFALVYAVATLLDLDLVWDFLIVGGAYLLIAGLLAALGARQLMKVSPPTKTIAALKNTPRALSNRSLPPT